MQWNEAYSKMETVEISAPTRMVTLPRRYTPGMGDLTVYLNGVLAVRDKQYKELTPFSIEWIDTDELDVDDVVSLHYQKFW